MRGTAFLKKRQWSPYIVGSALGVLSWIAFLTADHPLGVTTAFEYTAGLLLKPVTENASFATQYFNEESPRIDWEWTLVLGIFLGAFISATLSGDRTQEKVPPLWQQRFGSSVGKRYVAAFVGGALMMFGARMAKGCTSGHGISGALQLAASSWLFVVTFFIAGIATATVIYGWRGGKHNV